MYTILLKKKKKKKDLRGFVTIKSYKAMDENTNSDILGFGR